MEEEVLNETFKNEKLLNPIAFEDMAFFTSFIIGILSDSLIAYCILRFQKMQTTVNLCILNWSIASCLTLISQSRSYKLLGHVFGISMFSKLTCFTFEYQSIFHATSSIFMMMLSLDYIFKNFSLKKLKMAFALVWTVTGLLVLLGSILCANGIYIPYGAILLTIFLFLLLVIVLVKCCFYTSATMQKQKLRFIVVSCYLFYWVVFWVTVATHIMFYTSILNVIYILIFLLVYIYPLFNLLLLAYLDKNFKLCFMRTLKCSNSYVDATICYKENLEAEHGGAEDINDDLSEIDINLSSNNENM